MRRTSFLCSVVALAAFASAPALAQTHYPTQTYPSSSASMTNQTATKVPLTKVKDTASLSGAKVEDSAGNSVGSVQKVLTSAGKPTAIQVSTANKVVRIKATEAKYERSRNLIKTSLTRSQIKALPSVQGA